MYPTATLSLSRALKLLKPLTAATKPGGRPRSINLREILNAIF